MIARSPKLTTGCRSSRSEPELVLRRIATTGRSSTFHDVHVGDVEPAAVEQVEQGLAGVAADVVDGLVVVGPQLRGRPGRRRGRSRSGWSTRSHLGDGRRRRRRGARAGRRPRRGRARRRRAAGGVASARSVARPRPWATSAPSSPYSRATASSRGHAARGCCRRRRRRCRGPARASAPGWPWPAGAGARGTTSGRPRARRACGPRCLPWSVIMPSAGVGAPTPASVSGCGRRPRRPTSSSSARAGPSGPRACSFWVEMPISAPNPNSPPSVNRVLALTMTTAASTSAVNRRAAARSSVTIASVCPVPKRRMWSIASSRSSTTRHAHLEAVPLGAEVRLAGEGVCRPGRLRVLRHLGATCSRTPAPARSVSALGRKSAATSRGRGATRPRCRRWAGGSWR